MSEARRFGSFVLVGGLAALVNWASRIGFSAMGLGYTLAIVCAYIVGMITAYVLNRRFVFEASGRTAQSEIWRFVAVNAVALVQVWGVSVALERWLLPAMGWSWYPDEVAHAVGVVSPVLTSYLGHRYFTFGRKRGG